MQVSCRPVEPSKFAEGKYVYNCDKHFQSISEGWDDIMEETGGYLVRAPAGGMCRLSL